MHDNRVVLLIARRTWSTRRQTRKEIDTPRWIYWIVATMLRGFIAPVQRGEKDKRESLRLYIEGLAKWERLNK